MKHLFFSYQAAGLWGLHNFLLVQEVSVSWYTLQESPDAFSPAEGKHCWSCELWKLSRYLLLFMLLF